MMPDVYLESALTIFIKKTALKKTFSPLKSILIALIKKKV